MRNLKRTCVLPLLLSHNHSAPTALPAATIRSPRNATHSSTSCRQQPLNATSSSNPPMSRPPGRTRIALRRPTPAMTREPSPSVLHAMPAACVQFFSTRCSTKAYLSGLRHSTDSTETPKTHSAECSIRSIKQSPNLENSMARTSLIGGML